MSVIQDSFSIRTTRRNEMVDITAKVHELVSGGQIQNGIVTIYCPHTTAGITINENADPDVVHDILLTLNALIPQDRPSYRHGEGNSDAHMKSSLVGASEQVLLEKGRLQLGTWQGIYFCEFDGPRTRNVTVQVLGQ